MTPNEFNYGYEDDLISLAGGNENGIVKNSKDSDLVAEKSDADDVNINMIDSDNLPNYKPPANTTDNGIDEGDMQKAGSQDEIVIAVMGTTGSGKSSFVRLLSGDTSVAVGDSLSSETSEIQVVRFFDRASRRNVIIVDTPGFDDSREGVSDTEILKRITSFLLEMYDKDRKLNGLIYLQRISDPRFGGQSGRNLRMFRNLCGTDTFSNVVVLTTFWDKLASAREGEMREMQLMREYFKGLVDGGARFMRHDRSAKSAQLVLDHILTLTPKNVQIQHEIRVEGKPLEDTAAGSVHRKEVEEIIARHKKEVAELKAEMDDIKETNKLLAQELQKERAELQKKIEKWEIERLELQKGLDDEKKAVAQLTLDLDAQKLENEERTEKLERDWTDRLDSQAQAHEEAMQSVQARLDREREEARKNIERAEQNMKRLEERAEVDRKSLEEGRQGEVRKWEERMQAQKEAHEKALQMLQQRLEKEKEESQGNVKLAELRMKRLEEKAEADRKKLEEQGHDEELKWSARLDDQSKAYASALQKMQDRVEQENKKIQENIEKEKRVAAEARATAAERARLAAERALDAELNKSHFKRARELADSIPILGPLAKPSFALTGALLDLIPKSRQTRSKANLVAPA